MKREFKKANRKNDLSGRQKKEREEMANDPINKMELGEDLKENIKAIREILGDSDDLVVREFVIGNNEHLKAAIVFIDGLVDKAIIDENILEPLMVDLQNKLPNDHPVGNDYLFQWVKDKGLTINEVGETDKLEKVIKSILSGDCTILFHKVERALLTNTKGWDKRGVEEPRTESVVRGPRDGFTETLCVNTALIRRRLKDPDLRLKYFQVGERTNTDIAILYVEGLVDKDILGELERRIQAIRFDGALESGYIEQFIEDTHWSPFPQLQNTERPDKVVGNLLEGKIAIITDGTPFVLIAPATLVQFYHSPEDYYERFLIGTLIRFLRMFAMTIALFLPSLYIAFSSFHPEMIPSRLVIAMAAGRSTVPFPSVVEAFMMEVSIEILREASVRLPGPIGPTIGIVGALVIGQAAVQAGIVSPIMVIVVALTTIGSFASPSYSAAISLRLLRFPMMIVAGMFGLYGIMLFFILIVIHLCSLKPFGVPYVVPFSPSRIGDMKDTLVRAPLYKMKKRPSAFKSQDNIRVGSNKMKEDDHNGEQEQ